MVMKNGKKNFRKASGVFIMISVILIAVNQLLRDPEKYDTVTPSPAVIPPLYKLSVCVGDAPNNAFRYYDSSKTAKENYDYCNTNKLPDVVCDKINGQVIPVMSGITTTLSCSQSDNVNKAWHAGGVLAAIGGSYIKCDKGVTAGTTGGGLLIAGANQSPLGFSVGDVVNKQVSNYCKDPSSPMPAGNCSLPKTPTLGPACEPRGCGYETDGRACDTRAGTPKDEHCSICKYGWYGDEFKTHCCTEAQQGDNSYHCIMTCSNSSCKYTKNGDNSSFPEDACPEKNRGVMCDTRIGYDPHCSFCDLGYKWWGFDDWCCTEADSGCIQTCKNKCSGSTGITGCPYYSTNDCP